MKYSETKKFNSNVNRVIVNYSQVILDLIVLIFVLHSFVVDKLQESTESNFSCSQKLRQERVEYSPVSKKVTFVLLRITHFFVCFLFNYITTVLRLYEPAREQVGSYNQVVRVTGVHLFLSTIYDFLFTQKFMFILENSTKHSLLST